METKKSFILITKLHLKVSEVQNNSYILFCTSTIHPNKCIDHVNIKMNKRTFQFKSNSISDEIQISTDIPLQISSELYLQSNGSVNKLSSGTTEHLISEKKSMNYYFAKEQVELIVDLLVTCQNRYRGINCTDGDLCTKVPDNLCQHNGSCVEENDSIKCRCREGFEGSFCENQISPCRNHVCGRNSECVKDIQSKLQYRCDCFNGYRGKFCEDMIDPCQKNLCSLNSKCYPDSKEDLQYRCQCDEGYYGKLCNSENDTCASNSSLCSHFINATCINYKRRHYCYCDGGCEDSRMGTTTAANRINFPFKWPFSGAVSFILVLIEAMIIGILVIVLICVKTQCYQRLLKTDYDSPTAFPDARKEKLEFGSNYHQNQKPGTRKSVDVLLDGQDMQSFVNNDVVNDRYGPSTFRKS